MLNNLLKLKSYDLGPKAGCAALIAFLSLFTPLNTLAQSPGSDPVAALADQIDPSVPANANFYRYAVGKSLGSLTISPDKVRAGALDAAKTLANSRMQIIVDDSIRSGSKPTTPHGQIAAAYTSFADRQAIEKRGDAPLQTDLALIRRARSREGIARLSGRPGAYFNLHGLASGQIHVFRCVRRSTSRYRISLFRTTAASTSLTYSELWSWRTGLIQQKLPGK
jgi:hypothetical protein